MKGATHSDEPLEYNHPNLQLPLALQSVVSAHCLAVQPATLLLWFALTDHIALFSTTAGKCFQ